jgi:hypothetical protein
MNQMKRFSIVLTFVAAVSGVALFASPRVRADGTCGEKGQPSCPLQGWMEKNMQDPLDKKDLKAVAASLEKAATFVPDPKWNDGPTGWAKIAKDGAAAAKAGDLAATQQTCKSCHKAWRNEYKKQFRMRPISG